MNVLPINVPPRALLWYRLRTIESLCSQRDTPEVLAEVRRVLTGELDHLFQPSKEVS